MTEPGEDTCLRCRHPDHGSEECGALMGADDRCDCVDVLALIRRAQHADDPPPY